jgi:YggT family protein
MMNEAVIASILGSALTLYMLIILIRWTSVWIELDLEMPRLKWIPRMTDPLIDLMRRVLPSAGPMDYGPLAALMAVWLVRLLLLSY